MPVFADRLYVAVGNGTTGLGVWPRGSGDRGAWTRVGAEGFGDVNNLSPYYSNLAIFNNRLYWGTQNDNQAYTLTLTYTDEARLQAGAEEATLTCLYLDQTDQQWQDMPTDRNPVTNQVTCHADHFTEFALAAGKPPLSQTLFLPVIRRGS